MQFGYIPIVQSECNVASFVRVNEEVWDNLLKVLLLMNCGSKPIISENRLLTTLAWKIGERVDYALEGSIFVAGAVVQWLRDGLGIIRTSKDVEKLATSVPDNGGVYFVPALTGWPLVSPIVPYTNGLPHATQVSLIRYRVA